MGFRQQNKTKQNKHGKKDLLIMMIVAIIIIAIKKDNTNNNSKNNSDQNCGWSSVMTEQTLSLTEHFLLEICRNDWSVNGTI